MKIYDKNVLEVMELTNIKVCQKLRVLFSNPPKNIGHQPQITLSAPCLISMTALFI